MSPASGAHRLVRFLHAIIIVSYVLPYASGNDLLQLKLHQQQQHASPGRRSLALEEGGNTVAHQDPDLNLLQDLSTKDVKGALDDLVTELEEQVSAKFHQNDILGNLFVPCFFALVVNTRTQKGSTAAAQQRVPAGLPVTQSHDTFGLWLLSRRPLELRARYCCMSITLYTTVLDIFNAPPQISLAAAAKTLQV